MAVPSPGLRAPDLSDDDVPLDELAGVKTTLEPSRGEPKSSSKPKKTSKKEKEGKEGQEGKQCVLENIKTLTREYAPVKFERCCWKLLSRNTCTGRG